MPLEDAISTKRRRRGPATRGRAAIAAVLSALSVLFAAPHAALADDAQDSAAHAALERLYHMDYPAAEARVRDGLPAGSPRRALLEGLVAMNRFVDWGDTTALARAEAAWEPLSPRGAPAPAFAATAPDSLRLYRGLAGMQLSYAAALRGHRVKAAALALAARRQLDELPFPEARAAVQLYDYYRARLLERLPLAREASFDTTAFLDAAHRSPDLRDVLLTSLFWIHLDQGRPPSARALAEDFLGRYPGNRIGRELRAAALYHAGDLEGARAEQERLREEYAVLASVPGRLRLGQYRAAGNLARIAQKGEDPAARDRWLAEWRLGERGPAGPWLPGRLRRELSRL